MPQVLLIKVVEQVSILVARTSSSLIHIVGIEIVLHPKRKTQRKDYGRLLLLRTQNWAFLSTKPKPGFFFFVPQIGLFFSTQPELDFF